MRKALTLFVLTVGVLSLCAQAGSAQTVTPAQAPEIAGIRAQAERGDADAQYRLERIYARGDGIQRDDVQALAWLRRSAEQGNAKGQNAMGVMYAIGQDVPQDYVQAVAWYRKAAEQGYAEAQYSNPRCGFARIRCPECGGNASSPGATPALMSIAWSGPGQKERLSGWESIWSGRALQALLTCSQP